MPTKTPLISIILPVYNGEKTLEATVSSLVNQTFKDFELLVGIDGTKDNSKGIVEAFNDKRIIIIENTTNLGLAFNLNNLISNVSTSSKYIAMAEQDDVYELKRLEWQLEILEKYPEVGLVSGIAEFMNDKKSILFPEILVTGEQFPQNKVLFKYLYINQLKVVNTCMMFRKDVHRDNQFQFNNTYGNFNVDWNYIMRFSLVSQIYGIPKKLVRMSRETNHESVTTNKKQQHIASRQLIKDFKIEFPEILNDTDYKKALKFHRKVELGHHSKFGILAYCLYYYLLYFDIYFINYAFMRLKKYIVN